MAVQANVRGPHLGSFVTAAQCKVAADVKLPARAWGQLGGQCEHLKAAQASLSRIVPCFVLISGLLFMARGGLAPAAVFSTLAPALAGGVFALALRGLPSSVSAAVGLIALFSVSVLSGLVMMTAIRHRLPRGEALDGAIIARALGRLRPVMMTGLAASFGFVPMALATETGAEV
ncbi:efflux RND transporter permease subunit [Phenylobacterium sp. SCN 70-31]|uniref:efflux RND transporter permease subunit n=1 Tax=Phenylobacterium sp. SCN 70-31 TaxID=1660129 RepID=UPI000869ECA0|nr:efflux RND transporter permease subunit [Phenylobacterium sp. SCN 70-31]ODT86326.1 MAG: hypothetical protein ABS78_16740 [Phenylobacterium sp. SCN 70-31]